MHVQSEPGTLWRLFEIEHRALKVLGQPRINCEDDHAPMLEKDLAAFSISMTTPKSPEPVHSGLTASLRCRPSGSALASRIVLSSSFAVSVIWSIES